MPLHKICGCFYNIFIFRCLQESVVGRKYRAFDLQSDDATLGNLILNESVQQKETHDEMKIKVNDKRFLAGQLHFEKDNLNLYI